MCKKKLIFRYCPCLHLTRQNIWPVYFLLPQLWQQSMVVDGHINLRVYSNCIILYTRKQYNFLLSARKQWQAKIYASLLHSHSRVICERLTVSSWTSPYRTLVQSHYHIFVVRKCVKFNSTQWQTLLPWVKKSSSWSFTHLLITLYRLRIGTLVTGSQCRERRSNVHPIHRPNTRTD